ncbi:MAG: patatin family protein [Deltaproteobacteria bacterium]|nr:patatin family protein [Deltaproteobacteria bacterium]
MNAQTKKKKSALVLEGGGMRSSYVAGALLALQEMGMPEFDIVLGTSAGACCAANYLMGRPEYNQFVLEERLASPRFIQYKNILSKKNIMDIDYLMDDSFETLDGLQEKLQDMKTKFYIVVSNCETGETLYLDGAKENIREAIRMSCAIPYLYRRELYYHGDRVMDGGLTNSIPIAKAIEEGCENILVVCSRREDYRKKPSKFSWLNRLVFRQYPHVVEALMRRHEEYNQTIDLIEQAPEGVKITAIRPQFDLPVSRATRDRIKVRRGIQQGFYDAYQVLSKNRWLL